MEKKRILIVDDDFDLAEITRDMLCGYYDEVEVASDEQMAYELLEKKQYHIILLDINLPQGNGFDVCKELRRVSKVPVIFVSARVSEEDKIKGLDIGGDDYLEKPYSLKELLARINALLRRTYGNEEEQPVFQFGTILVDTGKRKVFREENEVRLALKEFDVLAYLCENAGRIIKKEELLQEVWGSFSEAEISTVAVHIRWLREKLEDNPSKPVYIQTVWGIGYILSR